MSSAARFLAAALTSVLALVLAAASPLTASAASGASEDSDRRYLVLYRADADVAAEATALRRAGLRVGRTFGDAVVAAVVAATPSEAAALRRSARVRAVEADRPVHVVETQTNPPWGLDRIDQRALPLSAAYTAPSAGAGVSAYVVDTGILETHADFGGRVAAGYTAISDGRGTTDCNGHGTHVAGTVAGETFGVAKAATLLPVRVLGCDGSGYLSYVVAGLDWVAAHHVTGAPAVVNVSLGGAASSTLDAALQGVVDDGVTAAVAAGNSAGDACTASPARLPAALTVAASDSADRQASFSNHGSCVDLYAPGVGISSAWHTSTTATASLSGTSMAAPHTAGAAALLLAGSPSLSPAQVATALTDQATTGAVSSTSAGTPNRLLFVSGTDTAPAPDATPPTAPTAVSAVAGKRSASVSWVLAHDGGSPLTGHTVTTYSGTKRVGTTAVAASATTARISGLKAGVSYAFTVTATNEVGSSPESARSNTVFPRR